MTGQNLLLQIEQFLARTGMSDVTFGHRVGNPYLVRRLRAGGDCHTRTAERCLYVIANHGAPTIARNRRKSLQVKESSPSHQD